MNLAIILTIYLSIFSIDVNTYRILGIFPFPFKSNSIFQLAVMKNLAKKGHQVDVISYHELSNTPTNYKTIMNLSNISYAHPKGKFNSIQDLIDRNRNLVALFKFELGLNLCNLMQHEQFQNLIQNPPKNPPYDLFVTQGTSTSCFFGFGSLLKVPVVALSPSLEAPPITRIIGNPLYTSFYQTTSHVGPVDIKTFFNRVVNTLKALTALHKIRSYTENQSDAMKKYFGSNISSVREVERNVSLFIANTHYSIQGKRPTVPGLIEAGGIHIEEDESSLTPDLEQWMHESKMGIVYMSIGTLVPIESFPKEAIRSIFSTFAKLAPIRFLIKATNGHEFPFELPKNVLAMTWIPQISVLRHNNTRLFITHGGLHSIMEAIYFGIPVVGIPIYFDQHQNVQIIVDKGMGLQLNHDRITEDTFHSLLKKILIDPKFKEAAKYHSQIFRDRPLSAGDETAYWIEYVIKNGANSLRSPAIDMFWWQTDLLDVFIFLLFIIIVILYTILIILKFIYARIVQIVYNLNQEKIN